MVEGPRQGGGGEGRGNVPSRRHKLCPTPEDLCPTGKSGKGGKGADMSYSGKSGKSGTDMPYSSGKSGKRPRPHRLRRCPRADPPSRPDHVLANHHAQASRGRLRLRPR